MTHGRQIQRAKQATLLNDKHIKTCIDKFAAGVYSRHDFLSAVSIQPRCRQLTAVTMWMKQTQAATTSTSSAPSDAVAPLVATAELAVCGVGLCLLETKAPLALVQDVDTPTFAQLHDAMMNCSECTFAHVQNRCLSRLPVNSFTCIF